MVSNRVINIAPSLRGYIIGICEIVKCRLKQWRADDEIGNNAHVKCHCLGRLVIRLLCMHPVHEHHNTKSREYRVFPPPKVSLDPDPALESPKKRHHLGRHDQSLP